LPGGYGTEAHRHLLGHVHPLPVSEPEAEPEAA